MVKLYFLLVMLVLTAIIVSTRWMPWWGAAIAIPSTILFFMWLTIWLIKRWFRDAMAKGLAEAIAPLSGATVAIHACHGVPEPASAQHDRERDRMEDYEPVEEPDPDEEPSELTPVRWVLVEMTVTPDPAAAEAALAGSIASHDEQADPDHTPDSPAWYPQQFSLVPADTPTYDARHEGVFSVMTRLQAGVARTERLSDDGSQLIFDSDDWLDAEEPEGANEVRLDEGRARLRLTFGIPENLNGPVKLRYLTLDLAELTLPAR